MAEYLYESARVRALENRLPTREQLEALISAGDWNLLLARLREIGIFVYLFTIQIRSFATLCIKHLVKIGVIHKTNVGK